MRLSIRQLEELFGVTHEVAKNWHMGRTPIPNKVSDDIELLENMYQHIKKSNNITQKKLDCADVKDEYSL